MTSPSVALLAPLGALAACAQPSPVGRYSHVGALDAAGASLAIAGGASSDGKLADAWRFDLGAGTWERLPDAPEPLFRATAVRGEGDDVWVFGGTGEDNRESDRLYRWSLGDGSWEEVTGEPGAAWPGPRYKAAATWLDGRMLVHGGRTDDGDAPVVYADLWAWDPASGTWEDRGTPGGAVYRQGLCADADGALWWSAGIDGDEVRGEGLHRLAPGASTFTEVAWEGEGPGLRASHTFLCGPSGLTLWGGTGEDTAVWTFDPSGLRWSAVDATPAPVARDAQVSAGASDGAFLVMGGDTADRELDDFVADLWRFHNGTWRSFGDP